MSNSEDKWKKKALHFQAQLKEKEHILSEYKKTIRDSNKLIKEAMNKLNTELKMAEQIHKLLLPVELPIIPNCEFSFKFHPSEQSGGGKDFYEVSPDRESKKFSIIMSSCSSYALSSLLLSARLKIKAHSTYLNDIKPEQFVRSLINEVSSDISTAKKQQKNKTANNLYTLPKSLDLFYSVVDQKTYNMFYCLIGKIKVLIHFAKTDKIKILNSCTNSSKLNKKEEFKSKVVSLDRGDRVIVCSPGILNCHDLYGETYSLIALKEIIQNQKPGTTVHDLRNHIMYELKQFCKGCPIPRDQSILVMEIKKHILKLATNE